MIPGIGTLINGFGVIVSGILARIIFKKELKNFDENLLPLGLLVLALGFRETLKSPDFIFTLFAVIVGSIIGSYLRIEDRVKNFGDYLYLKFEKGESDQTKFIESYLTTTLIVITGEKLSKLKWIQVLIFNCFIVQSRSHRLLIHHCYLPRTHHGQVLAA